MINHHDIAAQNSLDSQQLAIYHGELARAQRSTIVAYVLWWFFGWIGGHALYLGDYKRAAMIPLLFIGGWVVMLTAFNMPGYPDSGYAMGWAWMGMLMVFGSGLILIVDLFTLPAQNRKRDATLRADLIVELTAGVES